MVTIAEHAWSCWASKFRVGANLLRKRAELMWGSILAYAVARTVA